MEGTTWLTIYEYYIFLIGGESRRKTAAERLEADKFKYVKSEEVRQRRFTLELRTNSPPNNDSTGTHSMGTASTGSPINMDEDYDITSGNDVEGDMTAIMQTMANFTKVKSQSTTPVSSRKISNQSSEEHTDEKSSIPFSSNAEALHSISASRRQQRLKKKAVRSAEKIAKTDSNLPPSPLVTRLREKLHSTTSTAGHVAFNPPPSTGAAAEEASYNRKNSESENKGTNTQKSNSRALNKMKEGIKNVATFRAIMGLDKDSNSTGRQSRSAIPSHGRRYRSASAGPNILKTFDSGSGNSSKLKSTKSDASDSKNPLMSPRSQLKHVRQNLKKVKIGNTNNELENTHARRHTTSESSHNANSISGALRKINASSYVVSPPKTSSGNDTKADPSYASNLIEAKVESKPPIKPKSKTEKENLQVTPSIESQPTYFEVLKKRTGSSSSKEDDDRK